MKKYLVLYYTKTGNSKFLAEQTAQYLGADCRRIQPIFDHLFVLAFLSMRKLGIKTNIRAKDLAGYDEVVLLLRQKQHFLWRF